jgi:hypothetical protein
MFGSNDKTPVPAIAPRQAAFSRTGIKKYFRKFRRHIQLRSAPVRNKERRV